MIHIRRAGAGDCSAIADLLNEVIAEGGTTAMTTPVTAEDIRTNMNRDPRGIWHLAEDDDGTLMGYQFVDQWDQNEHDIAIIATFARVGRTGLGIGSALFEASRKAAVTAGFKMIEAEIRADNTGGLAYYQSRGFEDHHRIEGVRLNDGTVVDKVVKYCQL